MTYNWADKGSAPGVVTENSVDSSSLVDGSIEKADLSPEVQEGLDELNHIGLTDEDLEDIFYGEGQAG